MSTFAPELPGPVVIPLRPGTENEQLRYAVRAWQHWHPGTRVITVGSAPRWWRGEHIPTIQGHGPMHQWKTNFPRALQGVCDYGNRSNFDGFREFIWSADDIFPVAGSVNLTDTGDVPTFCRLLDLDIYLARAKQAKPQGYTKSFYDGVKSQRDILRAMGINTQHNADMHMPHQLNVQNVGTLLKIFADSYPEHEAGHFRAVYGGLWPGVIRRVPDPKLGPMEKIKPDIGWVSTSGASWKGAPGLQIREIYTRPSEYEGKQ